MWVQIKKGYRVINKGWSIDKLILIQTTTTPPLSSTSYYSDGGQYYVTFVTPTKGCEIDQDRESDVAEATEVLLGRRKNIKKIKKD